MVLANGLGGTFSSWQHVVSHLGSRYRILSWDYRGLYRSERGIQPITVESHTDDLEALLDAFGVERALWIGWSMGVQVNFELYRRRPAVFSALCCINGTAGNAFATMKGGKLMQLCLPRLLQRASRRGKLVGHAIGTAAHWKNLVEVCKRVGLVGPRVDGTLFSELAQELSTVDFRTYLEMLGLLGAHSAWDVLPMIDVPCTVVVGVHDLLTPVSAARKIAELMPDARLVILDDATHYVPLEQPELLNRELDALLDRSSLKAE